MARKLFSPATERSLRNDRVLNLAPLRFHPPSESFPLPANKDKLPRPPFLASLSTTRRGRGQSILAKHLTRGIISSLRGNAIPSPYI